MSQSANLKLWLGIGLLASSLTPRAEAVTLADYERAAVFQDARKLVLRTDLGPNWIGQSDRFWYLDDYRKIKTFILVDPDRNMQAPAFDHAKLAAALSTATGEPYSAGTLPFSSFTYFDVGKLSEAIGFSVGPTSWRCELRTYRCANAPTSAAALQGEVLSPDGRWAVFLKDYNFWVRDTISGEQTALTHDGRKNYSYGNGDTTTYSVTDSILGKPWPPSLRFSSDSRYALSYRLNERKVREQQVMETVPGAPPKLHSYRQAIPGDENVTQAQMLVLDLQEKAVRPLKHEPFDLLSTYDHSPANWSADGRFVAFLQEERGFRRAYVQLADARSGELREVVREEAKTYINREVQIRLTRNAKRVIWTSERDGWNHIYIAGVDGGTPMQLTSGEWVVREIVYVDDRNGYIYFTAAGREPREDPYYPHLYRVRLDGTSLRLLTPEPASHSVSMSPTGRYFVDSWSTLQSPQVHVLRRADGLMVRELQRADITALQAAGWKAPRSFSVKAHDGQTDIYGAMFLPSNFDSSKRYPVLECVYPGGHRITTPKTFWINGGVEDALALAELGFIVVTVDGLGTPLRSKAFRDVAYGNFGGGLEDHVAALKQLAERYPQMDLSRVGVFGHSGGGYYSTRAMLLYPDFYKVAVSSAGDHDQRSYGLEWGERFHHWPVTEESFIGQANPPLARNLRGRLLLVHGSTDENVNPDQTMQMVDALIEANKDFDLLILPNRNHDFANLHSGPRRSFPDVDPYFLRRRWDYFVQYLQGAVPPKEFQLEFKAPE